MKKLLVTLAALLFTSPAFAALDHWTCSNDTTVMYMVLDTTEGDFALWDDKGKFLVGAKFTDVTKTKDGTPVLIATLENGVGVGIAKVGDTIRLAFTTDGNSTAVKFTCN